MTAWLNTAHSWRAACTRCRWTASPNATLATSLLTFAHEVSAKVIAEGIETEAELDTLRGLGATLGQGYYLARPRDPALLFPS